MRDFVPVAPLNYSDLVLVVHPSTGVTSVTDLIKLAKASPGKLNYASSGPGTPYHMAGELFKAMAGVDIVHVPYKGSSGARTDVLGGQVQMMFDAVPTMSEHARRVASRRSVRQARRDRRCCPTCPRSEAGAPVTKRSSAGHHGAKGDAALHRQPVERGIANPEPRGVRQEWAGQGAAPMVMTPEEFARYLDEDIVKWERIVKISGAKPDQ
jgi:tripartite-type tricarboxylate transporter receptor subunit TctC